MEKSEHENGPAVTMERRVQNAESQVQPAKTSPWSVLGWAAYLACSWTWCIGMFLPVLLVRDYGVWGFVVFAVPNVIGAGAMGWMLKNGIAERILSQHRLAWSLFSIVTIAFQAFFAGWIPIRIIDGACDTSSPAAAFTMFWLFGTGIALVLLGLGFWKRVWTLHLAAALVLVASGVAAWYLARHGALDNWNAPPGKALLTQPSGGLSLLAPVCVFGFALCPYLDATFLRARRSMTHGAAGISFAGGFGVPFAAMILITLLATPLYLALLGDDVHLRTTPLAWVLVGHLVLQLWFTIEAHTLELVGTKGPRSGRGLAIAGLGLLFAVIGFASQHGPVHSGMSSGEIIYRCFMSFYGLVFPAYVWLCMIPTRDGHSGIGGERGRWKLMVLGGACVLAAPCYWMGFVERVEWWLAPGLGVVLLARLLVRKSATISE